jgi:hypothetical protein
MAPPITIADALATIQEEVAQGRLSLDRDIYQNIQLPTYQNITFPTSYGQNTGYLPADYPGPYAGGPTFGNVMGTAALFGDAGNDPRLAAQGYAPGSLTVAGQAQRLNEEIARAQQQQFGKTFGMTEYNANQARFNDYTDQANKDRQYALDINADPNTVVGGQILPSWLQPHAEWARQFASQNGGRLPTSQDLRTALGGYGQAPAPGLPVKDTAVQQLNTDYLALKQQVGQDLSYNDPRLVALYQKDLGEDPATAQRQAQAVSDWSRAHPGQTPDLATQTGLYNAPQQQVQGGGQQQIQGGAMQQMEPDQAQWAASARQAGIPEAQIQQQLAQYQQDKQTYQAGGNRSAQLPAGQAPYGGLQQGGGMQYGGPAMRAAPGIGGMGPLGGVNYGGSGQTGQIGAGQPMSLEQRRLIEQGRATDLQTQISQNQQRLQALQQESQLRADPFALARYRYGLGQGGQGGLIGAIGGQGVLPPSQGPQGAAPGQPSLANQQREMAGYPTFGQGGGMAGVSTPAQLAGYQQQLAALPQLNQIAPRNYLRAGAQGQTYANSAYRAAGLAGTDQDVQEAVQKALPQFARRGVPTFGRVAA